MSRFFVGQRVRVVRTLNFPSMLGREARITSWSEDGWDGNRYYGGWELSIRTPLGATVIAEIDDIEPIIDPGLVAGKPGTCTELDRLLAAERAES